MFSFLYRCLKNRHAHRILLRIIARSGGGLAFSSEVRKLYAEVHRIRIGYGTYGGCFDTENIPPDVSFGNYCSIASGVRIFRANHPSGRFTTHPILYNPVMGYVEKDMLEKKLPRLKVAVMGCAVNGPGEASDADFGIACGDGKGVYFRGGKIVKTVAEEEITDLVISEIRQFVSEIYHS